ncbi:hypothetical protein RB594_000402 [Gaeumannomyces avenae]
MSSSFSLSRRSVAPTYTTTHAYTFLPEGSVRLLRLLPSPDARSHIECGLLDFPVLDSEASHPYEALSYAWGDEKAADPIYIDGKKRRITANLYAALSSLRHCFLERVLWIDAICINQDDTAEKNRQVQSMAKIYSKASRVIVWLGEGTDNGTEALEAIRMAAHRYHHTSPACESDQLAEAEEEPTISLPNDTDQKAILDLLQRPWFQRVWVLQEVAAGRDVLFKCGPREIGGYAFCHGIDVLTPYLGSSLLSNLVASVAYLIMDSAFRPRSEIGPVARFSLNIRPLGELVDMYKDRKATDLRDKVYALLGMSSDDPDDPDAAGLSASYAIPWRDVFRDAVHFCLSYQASVITWDGKEVAVVEADGRFLGQVISAHTDKQHVRITWRNVFMFNQDGQGELTPSDSTFRASVNTVKKGDFVCLLKGASSPTIIRLHDDYSVIILSAVPRTSMSPQWADSIPSFPTRFLLVWDWSGSEEKPAECYRDYLNNRGVPGCSIPGCMCSHFLDMAVKWWDVYLLLSTLRHYEEATKHLKKAIYIYDIGAAARKVNNTGGQEHIRSRQEDEKALNALDELLVSGESAIIKTRSDEVCLSLPRWAFKDGHQVLGRLLIENKVNIETRDMVGETPLQWAVRKGAEALVRLLIKNGADVGSCDLEERTMLHLATHYGHAGIVKLLVVEGGSDKDRGDGHGQRPLHYAAERGNVPLVRLLAVELGADKEAQNSKWETPLHSAAANGHVDVVRLLVKLGADKEAQNSKQETPLYSAAERGHIATNTPSRCALNDDRTAVARLLVVELCADKYVVNGVGRTPLALAEQKFNTVMIDLLK